MSPCQCRTSGCAGSPASAGSFDVVQIDRAPADLARRDGLAVGARARVRVDARARRRREQLRPEADAEHGRLARQQLAQQRDLLRQKRKLRVARIAHAHRSAHDDQQAIGRDVVGHGRAVVDRDRLHADAARREQRGDALRPFGRRVLQNDGARHARIIAHSGGGASIKIVSPEIGCRKRTDSAWRCSSLFAVAAARLALPYRASADDRKPRRGQVRAHLVVPSRRQPHAQQRRRRAPLDHLPGRLGRQRLAAAADPHAPAAAADAADRRGLDHRNRRACPRPRPDRPSRSRRRSKRRAARARPRRCARRPARRWCRCPAGGPGRPRGDRATRPRIRGSARRSRWPRCPAGPARSGCDGRPAGFAIAISAASS